MTRICYQGYTQDLPPEAVVVWATSTMIIPLKLLAGMHWALTFAMPGRFISDSLRLLGLGIQ